MGFSRTVGRDIVRFSRIDPKKIRGWGHSEGSIDEREVEMGRRMDFVGI
jgi:hypothetical protein